MLLPHFPGSALPTPDAEFLRSWWRDGDAGPWAHRQPHSPAALAGPAADGSYPSSYPYAHPGGLFDVTSGVGGRCAGSYLCTAGAGYDGPTGLGTPDGTTGFTGGAPVAGCSPAQLLRDPGFERRRVSPWKAGPHVVNNATKELPAHTGSRMAWLDGYGFTHTDTVAQTVTIPAGCQHATFSFWLSTQTDDSAGPAADTFTVRVLDSSGAVLRTLARYSNKGAVKGYHKHSFSLARYAGQQITLKFTGKETAIGMSPASSRMTTPCTSPDPRSSVVAAPELNPLRGASITTCDG